MTPVVDYSKVVKPTVSKDLIDNALGLYNLNGGIVKQLIGGITNMNYIVDRSSEKFFLRFFSIDEDHTKENILEEVRFVDFLNEKDFPIPIIYKSKRDNLVEDVGDYFVALYEYVEGVDARSQLLPIHFSEIGSFMGRYHSYVEDNNFRVNKTSKTSFRPYDYYKLEENLAYLSDYPNQIKEITFILGKETIKDLDKSLEKRAMHSDIHFGNILFMDNKISAVIDFDACSNGYFIQELARFLFIDLAFSYKLEFRDNYQISKQMIEAFWDGYTSNRKLSETEISMLDDILVLTKYRRGKTVLDKKPDQYLDYLDKADEIIAFTNNALEVN